MGKLSIVSTPIGNLEDVTLRAGKTLISSDAILCEDTRRTGLLLNHLRKEFISMYRHIDTKTPKLIRYYDEIEDKKIPEIIELLQQGKNIALVSDAGTPLISDPGFRLVRECVKRGIKVESIPGPSAALAALTSSGLPPDKFIFLGFFDKKSLSYVQKGMTTVFYCSPHKILRDLENIRARFGDIPIVIARELTKIHEEIWHGTISEAQSHFSNPQGEFVVLFNIPQA